VPPKVWLRPPAGGRGDLRELAPRALPQPASVGVGAMRPVSACGFAARAYDGRMATDGLLERERELAELDALIEQACEGRGRSIVVEGPAGIGKSRLLTEARGRADGMLVPSARGSELEREFLFGVVRQRLLAGAAASAASVFGQFDSPHASGADGASFAAARSRPPPPWRSESPCGLRAWPRRPPSRSSQEPGGRGEQTQADHPDRT